MYLLLASISLASAVDTNSVRWTTNYPGVFERKVIPYVSYWTNQYPARSNELKGRTKVFTNTVYFTNEPFSHYVPASFPERVWTNFIARTNGRDMRLWSVRSHPADWPKSGPVVKWNRNSLVYGLHGFTALSPCWETEGSPGQVPITALTRRHGYTRGHGMGPSGFGERFAGKAVWFITANDGLIKVRVAREVVRTQPVDHRDYTILLFDRDLPDSIQPMLVADDKALQTAYPYVPGGPRPLFKTEQSGYVSTDQAGLSVNTFKGGDSGSPDMLPLEDKLLFLGGRSSSSPSPEMQADMDELCKRQKLNPRRYQMRWVEIPAPESH